jgi:hypothetical protein
MLPAWATVAIALGAAAITGIAALGTGGLRMRFEREQERERRAHERAQQEAQLQHEREEAWRTRLLEAADNFASGVTQALLVLRNARNAIDRYGSTDDKGNVWLSERISGKRVPEIESAFASAQELIDEAHARFSRVQLLFGRETEVGAIALALVLNLREAMAEGLAAWPFPALKKYSDAFETAISQEVDFSRAALEAIRRAA